MNELTLAAALFIGLLGSTHCIGMCGGISSVLGISSTKNPYWRLLSYNAGRLLTYSLMGIAVGFFGEQLVINVPQLGVLFRTLAGGLLIAMGLYISQWWMGLTYLEKMGSYLWQCLQPLSKTILPITSARQALLLGFLWGLLPCGLVYSTLSWALASADWKQSGLLMLAFGIGTLPAMLSMGFLSESLMVKLRKKSLRLIAGVLVIVMGVITIIAPWSHRNHIHHAGVGNESHQHHYE